MTDQTILEERIRETFEIFRKDRTFENKEEVEKLIMFYNFKYPNANRYSLENGSLHIKYWQMDKEK